ncbi:MAG: DUF4340 domain-containing protein [Gemmataceae bacterium]
MNLRSTVVLFVLLAGGAVLAWYGPAMAPRLGLAPEKLDTTGAGTLNILENELTPAKVTRIEVRGEGQPVTLERSGSEWSLPGKWPTRKPEVEELVRVLTSLRSRFVPIPVPTSPDPSDLAPYGLDRPSLAIVMRGGDMDYRLQVGEEKAAKKTKGESPDTNTFARPTYLRVDDKPEVIRLEPGLIARLDKPVDYYQQRRLFQSEMVTKSGEGQDRVEQLAAVGLTARQKQPEGAHYALVKQGDSWQLKDPVIDRVDPDKLSTVLTAVPDLWAEKFVESPKKDLTEYGLKEPEDSLSVTLPGGDIRILQIGKVSGTKVRHITKQPPPGLGSQPPRMETVTEEYRYAKLQNNDQIFEIKADKLKDIFVAAKELRDPRLARFETKDVKRLELIRPEGTIVLVKDKDHWKMDKPLAADAEESKVSELLDKLARLEARDQDIADSKDLKGFGLDKPIATVKVTAEEESKEDKKKKTDKVYTFVLGKYDVDKKKVYVRLDGWDRINAVEDSVVPLVKRSELAYRGRRVLDFTVSAIDTIEIQRPGEKLTLKQDKGSWKLTAPSQADADSVAAGQLASSVSNLESVEYVSEAPKPEDLDKLYGLAKPALTVAVTFTDKTKSAQSLQIGKQREGKSEYFAKLASAPGVFVIRKDLHDVFDKGSLAYRPLQLWQVLSSDVADVRIKKEGQEEYDLNHKGSEWKITGPFEATAVPTLAQPMTQELAGPRCERYESHSAKDLQNYGLDKPYLRVAVTVAPKKADNEPKKDAPAAEAPKEKFLLIGKPTGPDAKTRFAKLANDNAVFVVGDKLVQAVDHDALDLLDRKLLAVTAATVDGIHTTGGESPLLLQKKGDAWQVLETPALEFTADSEAITEALNVWANLKAEKFAAYGAKAQPAQYGLDKPRFTIKVKVQQPEKDGKKPAPTEHTLALGKAVGNSEECYARLDNGPGIAVLSAATTKELTRSYLDYVDRTLFNLEPESIKFLVRKTGNDVLELAKRDEGWQILKPADQRADEETLQKLTEQLAHLRAARVAAYPAKDLKTFALDAPASVLTLKVIGADGKPLEKNLNLGKAADEATGDQFAQAVGSQAVVVLPGSFVKRLTAPPLAFRDRKLVRFADADKLVLERGSRKAVFTKVEGTWKLTEPLEAQAEQTDLEEFINEAARLQAEELVADKPADLKPYGLDKPEARWRFLSGDKEVLNLLIGAKDPTGSRVNAKLANDGLVFLLKPSMTAKALAEYRNRTIWPAAPDAAQVEGLHFGYAKNPFTLEKTGGVWQVQGKPDFQVSSRTMSDTLAAISGLKVERYVADKDADLQLYGLDKPELALDIQTPAGKKTLNIGRQEGGSKRYYAQVPEKKGEVFVISEADAGRIVRDLAAFKESSPKASAPAGQ